MNTATIQVNRCIFDCYRIENEEEAYDFGAEEYLFSKHICLVEWPENIHNLLPEAHHQITMEKVDSISEN